MRRLIFTAAALITANLAMAQSVIVVDSEKVFKSLPEYTEALAQVEQLSKDYQTMVDSKFADVEQMFNDYATLRSQMSAAQQSQREALILSKEKSASQLQEQYFGKKGTIMQRRVELIKPIQERVFKAIESYATANGAEVVLDKASNAQMLYSSPKADRTAEIIEALND